MKAFLLISLYFLAVSAPLALSWSLGLEPRPWRQELASGIGILAFSIILAEFILSGRSKTLSKRIGMDVTMRFHRLVAQVAVGFALLHPFLYGGALSGGARPWDDNGHLSPTTDFLALSSGIAAFLILPSLILLAVGRTQLDYKYETWRLMHGIGAALIAALLLHHTLSAGRYGAHPELFWLWWAMVCLALSSLLYVYLGRPYLQSRAPWKVASIVQRTPKQWELTIAPDDHGGLDYVAGQFVWLNVGHSPYSLYENPFSISSAPASGRDVSFLIKELGDFTQTLGRIKPQERAYLDGPYGNLTIQGRNEPGVALIAGGVGIAPLLGILRQMRLTDDPRARKLIYGNRAEEQIACREELGTREVTYVLSQPPEDWQGETGFIDGDLMDRVFAPEDYRDWVFVLCGPGIMLDVVEKHLRARSVSKTRILAERFDYD